MQDIFVYSHYGRGLLELKYIHINTICFLQAMARCSQPIPCSTFNNDGSLFAYAVCLFSVLLPFTINNDSVLSLTLALSLLFLT